MLAMMVRRLTSPALQVNITLPVPSLLSTQLRLWAKLYTVLSKERTIGRELFLSVKCRESNLPQKGQLSLQQESVQLTFTLRSDLALLTLYFTLSIFLVRAFFSVVSTSWKGTMKSIFLTTQNKECITVILLIHFLWKSFKLEFESFNL